MVNNPVLVRYYNDVKDPLWPEIATYADFLRLPESIKQECYEVFNFQEHLDRISDPQYWIDSMVLKTGYRYKNVIYVREMKCAGSYYGDFFESIGWEKIDLNTVNLRDYYVFGLIMDPIVQHLKVTAQAIGNAYCKYREDEGWKDGDVFCYDQILHDIKNTQFQNLARSIIITSEQSALPYTTMYGDALEHIDWIPWEYGNTDLFKDWIEMLLRSQGIDVTIPRGDKHLRWSYPAKRRTFELLADLLAETETTDAMVNPDLAQKMVYYYYADDLKFYHRLLERFNPDGKTWDEISWLIRA